MQEVIIRRSEIQVDRDEIWISESTDQAVDEFVEAIANEANITQYRYSSE